MEDMWVLYKVLGTLPVSPLAHKYRPSQYHPCWSSPSRAFTAITRWLMPLILTKKCYWCI